MIILLILTLCTFFFLYLLKKLGDRKMSEFSTLRLIDAMRTLIRIRKFDGEFIAYEVSELNKKILLNSVFQKMREENKPTSSLLSLLILNNFSLY